MTPTKEQINLALASQVRAGMALRSVTIAELADRLGWPESTINRIRGGADLQVSKLYQLADALDLDPVKMIEDALAEAKKAQ